MGKNRLEAFSDGVIAIIIAIMVLEMKTSFKLSSAVNAALQTFRSVHCPAQCARIMVHRPTQSGEFSWEKYSDWLDDPSKLVSDIYIKLI